MFGILEPVKIGGNVCRYSPKKCEELAPIVNEILKLKREKNAVILAHSYVSPDVLYTVADFTGDSYKLSLDARKTDAQIIVFVAVRFMAETAKILNPEKRVFVGSEFNGCSLADSIDALKVGELKKRYPDRAFVCYINTTAEVKALCDVCVTSSNVYQIVQDLQNDKVFFLPDKLMGMNLVEEMKRRGVKKDIVYYDEGMCYVHEEYDPDMIDYLRMEYENLKVLSHPECSKEVIARSDFVGSTEKLLSYVKEHGKGNYLMLTECGLLDRVSREASEATLVGSCRFCKYMKSNSLLKLLETLRDLPSRLEIKLDEEVRRSALISIENMFKLAKK